ncbi:uncharacterized protein BX664DRAFT_334761 [Halteromyces radiatus]|uniref:uncharacterized protein n=1 Tax=Halteromyces radiatus TaxID=101107 RepID=UPI0022209570|nr:uncharacterized protein BX664DRAFT_334761 [Halteromyces radiatus]KAI8086040.1 hypothetical protein BX664DRAFT_334761 [Halteromyces radiatus]
MVKTLYEICLDNLISYSAYVDSLTTVTFEPFMVDLLNHIFTDNYLMDDLSMDNTRKRSQRQQQSTINIPHLLARIGDTHGHSLCQPQYIHFSSVETGSHGPKSSEQLSYFSNSGATQFITRLDLSMTWINDNDIPQLKTMVNLNVLDLTGTLITDYGVSHLARLSQLKRTSMTQQGLPYLKILSLAYNRNITDGCLKHLRNIHTLSGVDLSTTNVNVAVARFCLKQYGYIYNGNDNNQSAIKLGCTPKTTINLMMTRHDSILDQQQRSNHQIIGDYKENEREWYCPLHKWSLITYGSSSTKDNMMKYLMDGSINPGYRIHKNEKLMALLGNNFLTDKAQWPSSHYGSWRSWWKKHDGQRILVFTRPSLENRIGSSTSTLTKRQRPLTGPLPIKRTKNINSILEEFQW